MWRLFLLVTSLTAVSFGGGSTLLGGMERELVQTGVITPEQFAVAMALGQSTPGPIAAFTTAVGMAVDGLGGAVAATAGLIAVSLSAVFFISKVPATWFKLASVKGALEAVGPLATAIVFFLAARILVAGSFNGLGLAIAAGVTVAKRYRLPTAPVMIGAVALGMWLH